MVFPLAGTVPGSDKGFALSLPCHSSIVEALSRCGQDDGVLVLSRQLPVHFNHEDKQVEQYSPIVVMGRTIAPMGEWLACTVALTRMLVLFSSCLLEWTSLRVDEVCSP